MNRVLKFLFVLIAKFLIFIILGLRIKHKELLPSNGPAILVANHNSHLDTFAIMSLFPLSMAHNLRPLANEQYFLQKNSCLAWFSQHVLDIIPVRCNSNQEDSPKENSPKDICTKHRTFFKDCAAALAQNQILILYPEGSRGEPESLKEFRCGIAHLAKRHPNVPIIPIFIYGLGKALPKGKCLLVPFLCFMSIGQTLYWGGDKQTFLHKLREQMQTLSAEQMLAT
ncbi:lysophospholipid acyltransferase family protein [Mastigocoleus sp. MO_188.B34]|uniref:lysophospholipid acyltransferase family protein n=1 Tax=Mastigocoleus sp. MO_188.B34 TaxID=3036635 RepID=UPI00262501A9|nr:lysophospholipid acyltransferase family protein [Mastigocoleus sp. MO_188.B34]MDJ0697518.1 lysophospholipid acyltransferase family protein [Mastigocoleus sp. MO_188.B34]